MAIELDDLDPDQRVAATAPRGPVCILAGAGTGKTRTITYRIAHLIDSGLVSPKRILAVTFTNRAAGEMRDRLASLGIGGVQARTFHAAAFRQLKYFWPQIAGDLPWAVLDNEFGAVARAARSVGLDQDKETIRDVKGEITWAKSFLVTPEGYAEAIKTMGREAPQEPQKIAEVYRTYEDLKNTADCMYLDYADVLLHVAGALENSASIAQEFRDQYNSFVVDEYQDVSPLQQRVLEAWLGQRDDLTVVGDVNQTIYSFAGATPEYLLNFSRTYDNAVVLKLERDYRSTPQVTELANAIIAKAQNQVDGARLQLHGMRAPGPQPEYKGFEDEPAEARAVALRIRRLLDEGVPAREIAVLYRINFLSAAFEQALREHNIPYQVRGGESFFQRPEVRQGISELVRASRRQDLPEDPLLVARAALAPLGLSAKEPQGEQARDRWNNLKALVDLVEELKNTGQVSTVQQVVKSLQQRAEDRQPPVVDSVTLTSMHAAKGLEWDAVFVVGAYEGMLPFRLALKGGQRYIEEERRLFYVAVTRAREQLFISWSAARQVGGNKSRKRTSFLQGIAPEPQPVGSSPKATRQTRCTRCNLPLHTPKERILARHEACPNDADQELFEQLRIWRRNVARLESKPAFMVFSDAVLLAIAEHLPADHNALMDIPGIGPAKLELYGEDIMALVNQFR